MKESVQRHIVEVNASVRDALIKLDSLASDAILFLVDSDYRLMGSLTDGDIRRGLIKGLGMDSSLTEFIQPDPSYIYEDEEVLDKLELYKSK